MARRPDLSQPIEEVTVEQEVHLLDYLRVILRRKWVIIIFFCTVVTSTAIFTLLKTPIYKAECKIRIYKEAPKVAKFEEIMPLRDFAQEAFLKSEIEVLKSRSLMSRVVNRLHLDLHPEFAGSNPSPSIWSLFGLLKKRATDKPVGDDPTTRVAEALNSSRITVETVRASQIVTIAAEARDKALSASLANTLAEEYIRYNLEARVFVGTSASEELMNQLQELKRKLEESEKKLYEYAKQNEMVALGETEALLTKKIDELNKQLSEATTGRIKAESVYVQSASLNPGYLPAILKSDVVADLEKKYAEVSSEYMRELERVQPEHPKAKQLKAKLDSIEKALDNEKQKITHSIKEEYVEVVEREKGFNRQMEDLLAQKENLGGKLVQYRILKRDVDTNGQLYEAILQRMKEVSITSEIKTPSVTILDRAVAPNRPYKPKKKLNLLLAALVGAFGGVGLAFFMEYLDTSVKSQEDIERKIGLTFLGAIPNLSYGKKGRYY